MNIAQMDDATLRKTCAWQTNELDRLRNELSKANGVTEFLERRIDKAIAVYREQQAIIAKLEARKTKKRKA